MKQILILAAFFLFITTLANGQSNYRITSYSAGNIKLGMTVAQARRAMNDFRLKRTSDGEGVALIEVSKRGKEIMTLYAGEENRVAKINENAKIEQIWVWDSRYRTVDGVHPEMRVRDAERILGKVKRVFMSEIESREFVEFPKKTKGLLFRIRVGTEGKYLTAGTYPKGKREGTRCVPTATIISVQVSDYFD